MKNILVTGGAGFIGSNLIKRLSKDETNNILSIDNYSSGSTDNHVTANNVKYLDLSTKFIDNINFVPHLIFHLGEYSRVEQSFNDFDDVVESNVVGTLSVVKFAKKHNAKLIYAGSSTKFGDNGSDSSPYAWSKAANTKFVKNFAEWYNLNYAITYFYNVYGPGEISTGKYSTVVAKFLNAKRNGRTVQITSPGTQQRNFTHIDDTVDALILIAERGIGDEYGIGSGVAYSIIDLAEMIGVNWEFAPAHKGNRLTAPVISDKTKALGWKQQRFLNEYITQELNNEKTSN